MLNEDINKIAYYSAKTYLKFLEESEKTRGIEKISVVDIKKTEEPYQIELILSQKLVLKIPELIYFEINDTIYEQKNNLCVISIQQDLLTLGIYKSDLYEKILNTKAENIKIVVDLKFLTKRVRDWYYNNNDIFTKTKRNKNLHFANTLILDELQPSELQRKAINLIISGYEEKNQVGLSEENAVTYIWGAPGTGKTKVVMAYAVLHYLNYCSSTGEKVLLVAPTNVALDQMLFSFIDIMEKSKIDLRKNIIRMGTPTPLFREKYQYLCYTPQSKIPALEASLKRNETAQIEVLKKIEYFKNIISTNNIRIDVYKKENDLIWNRITNVFNRNITRRIERIYILTNEIKTCEDNIKKLEIYLKKLKAEQIDIEKEIEKEKLKENTHIYGKNVIACTIDYYISNEIHKDYNFAHIFLDEAGYTSLIKALTLFVNDCPITFLGDHLQLKPICEMTEAEMKKEENKSVVLWTQSAIYIHDMFNCGNIDEIYNRCENYSDYSELLKTISLNKTFRFPQNIAEILEKHVYKNGFSSLKNNNDTNIFYVDVQNKVIPDKKRENIAEAEAINKLYKSITNKDDFVILTPYKNQVALIKKQNTEFENKVLTVHKSQGNEWETVIFSVSDTLSNAFLTNIHIKNCGSVNVLNTALSRTKKNLIIVCDYKSWISSKNQMISDLLRIAKKINL